MFYNIHFMYVLNKKFNIAFAEWGFLGPKQIKFEELLYYRHYEEEL